MNSSLIGRPIHSALCHIEAKSFVNYYLYDILEIEILGFGKVLIVMIMSCYLHEFPDYPSFLAGPLDYILCPYRAVVNVLVGLQRLHIRVKGFIEERPSLVHPYFSSSLPISCLPYLECFRDGVYSRMLLARFVQYSS